MASKLDPELVLALMWLIVGRIVFDLYKLNVLGLD